MPCNAPVAAAFPVAPPVGADRLICDSTPFATVPAPENAVPVIGVIDNSWRPPDATPAPESPHLELSKQQVGWQQLLRTPGCSARQRRKRQCLEGSRLSMPRMPHLMALSATAWENHHLLSRPGCRTQLAHQRQRGKSPFAVEAPVADPVAADNEPTGGCHPQKPPIRKPHTRSARHRFRPARHQKRSACTSCTCQALITRSCAVITGLPLFGIRVYSTARHASCWISAIAPPDKSISLVGFTINPFRVSSPSIAIGLNSSTLKFQRFPSIRQA